MDLSARRAWGSLRGALARGLLLAGCRRGLSSQLAAPRPGKRRWDGRWVYDRSLGRWVQSAVLACPVFHPELPTVPLWLVVSRWPGRTPWYLLTNQPATTAQQAWEIVRVYHLPWQIELVWRFDKSELGFASPRVWGWDNRLKLLSLASLAYAFLSPLFPSFFSSFRLNSG